VLRGELVVVDAHHHIEHRLLLDRRLVEVEKWRILSFGAA
jgi:hypothetical protein